MEKRRTENENPEAKLAEMLLEPSAGFSSRVLGECLNEAIERKLSEMPVEPSSDFSARVMAMLKPETGRSVIFPLRFKKPLRIFRISATGIVVAACAIGLSLFSEPSQKSSLNEQVANVLNSDFELAELVAVEEDEFSFGELLLASRLLTTLNNNSAQTADFFVYYEN